GGAWGAAAAGGCEDLAPVAGGVAGGAEPFRARGAGGGEDRSSELCERVRRRAAAGWCAVSGDGAARGAAAGGCAGAGGSAGAWEGAAYPGRDPARGCACPSRESYQSGHKAREHLLNPAWAGRGFCEDPGFWDREADGDVGPR